MKNKEIVSFNFNPLSLDLVDRKISLFIDSNSGEIFLDEGNGPDRMNGGCLFAL